MVIDDNLSIDFSDTLALRTIFRNPSVRHKLQAAGIDIIVYELHSPAVGAKKSTGLGVTLCGRRRAMRSTNVTCKKCLQKLRAQG